LEQKKWMSAARALKQRDREVVGRDDDPAIVIEHPGESITPALGEVVAFDGIPDAHQRMGGGVEVFGNRVALVGAPEQGLGAT
jgi:hypothetical protein